MSVRGKNGAHLHFFSPSQYQEAALNSLDIYQPGVMLPAFPLAVVQHLITSGALYPASQESIDAIPGKHFGDGFAFPHLQTIFELYDFGMKDKADRVNAVLSSILSLLFVLRALFGIEGAFRFWCAIFEAAFGGVKVDFPDGAEPVAVLGLGDEQEHPGWDGDFGSYGLWTVKTLENAVNQQKAMTYWQQASLLPESSYPVIAVQGFMRLTHDMGGSRDRRIDGYGDIYKSVVFDVAKKNRAQLVRDLDPLNTPRVEGMRAMFGDDVIADPSQARAWGDAVSSLRDDPLNRAPQFPIKGLTTSFLSRLGAHQRYGHMRDGGRRHEGLDLPAAEGTQVIAMYDGVVAGSEGDWKEGGSAKGNYVIVKSMLQDKGKTDVFSHEYYHLSATDLERGDSVRAGQVIGLVGDTGNSHGPHLHLATRWGKVDDDTARTSKRSTFDPEQVLMRGAVDAANVAGHGFGSPARPHLALPLYTLQTISGGGYSSPVSPVISQAYAKQVALELERSKPDVVEVVEVVEVDPNASGGLSDEKKAKLKGEVRKVAPGVLGITLTATLVAAGVPPEVATAAGKALKITLDKDASGSPQEISAQFRSTVPSWGVSLDEAEPALQHALAWLAQQKF